MSEELVALVVNAGGQSRRMGQAKALLPMPPEATPLIVHIIKRLAPLVSAQVIVVTNDEGVGEIVQSLDKVVVVPDRWPDGGSLGGVATGLAACEGWAMVVACDMPLVDGAIFAELLDVAREQSTLDAVIPRVVGQAQPFHGVWHKRALPIIEARLAAGDLRVVGTLSALNVAWLDEVALGVASDAFAFRNVNTPEEWRALLEELER